MKIKVSYPSGHVLHISGEWKGAGMIKDSCTIVILIDKECILPGGGVIEKGSFVAGDIRGVYQNEYSGEVLYNPRDYMEGMDKWAVGWLNEHPEWPALLEL